MTGRANTEIMVLETEVMDAAKGKGTGKKKLGKTRMEFNATNC